MTGKELTGIVKPSSLEEQVAALLVERRLTVAVAESCTGGLICHRLTNVSGSSDYFHMGVVTYSNRAKSAFLGVPEGLISQHGAVSEACVRAMASGVRKAAGADLGLAVSGIAGPTGGSAEKPVGTVHLALAHGDGVDAWQFHFEGGRLEIKDHTARAALERLRDYCKGNRHGEKDP